MQRSYSKKAFPWDNACIESFHSIIKREWLNRFKIRDYKQASNNSSTCSHDCRAMIGNFTKKRFHGIIIVHIIDAM